MSTISGRILQSKRPGYWAVQIRNADDSPLKRRYLCHAQDARSAAAMAGRLMGSAPDVRGFSYYWIEPGALEARRTGLPPLGEHQAVVGARSWADLIAAHKASQRDVSDGSVS